MLFIVLAVVAEWVHIPTSYSILTVNTVVTYPTFIIYGPVAAAWVYAVSALVSHGLLRRREAGVAIFNAGQYVLCALIAGLAYYSAGGIPGAGKVTAANWFPLFVYVLTFFVTNHMLVSTYFTFSTRELSWRIWLDPIPKEALNYAISVPVGLGLAALHQQAGPAAAIAIFVPMIAVAYIFKLYASLELANRELTTLYQITHDLSSTLDLDRVLELAADGAERIVRCDFCLILLWNESRDKLVPRLVRHPTPEKVRGFGVGTEEGVIGAVVATKTPEIVADVRHDPRSKGAEEASLGCRSLIAAPLLLEEMSMGAIVVGREEPGAFSPNHLRGLVFLSKQVAVVVQNALLYEKAEELAITDPLTKLYNHRYFYERLSEETRRARRFGTNFSLIYIDLDNLKDYNDVYGHLAGDHVLREVARVIWSNVREVDVAARYGGDEFAVLLVGADTREARGVAERIRAQVEKELFPAGKGKAPELSLRATISAGVATFPVDADNEADLVHKADRAMYLGAKQRGRNRVHLFSDYKVADAR